MALANVRFGSKADMCGANGMSALHPIATEKADIALQDACSSRRHRRTGNLRAVQLLLGHTKMHCAALGIDVATPSP